MYPRDMYIPAHISLVICASLWYVYPRTHITSDMCIPGRDTQNTVARPGMMCSVKHDGLGQARS